MKNLFFMLSFALAIPVFGQKNLIDNGGFETDKEFWNGEDILTISPYTKKSGAKSGSITEYTSPQWKGVYQEFSIPKNTVAIEVSGWLKTDGVEKGKSDWNKAVMIVEMGGKAENIASLDGTTAWTEFKKLIPVNKIRIGKLMLALSECTGTFYFDDIRITALNQEAYNKIAEKENNDYSK
ncbi:MAG: hypothetical protein QM564_05990 [Bergeyella sp.]